MTYKNRYLKSFVAEALTERMVFIGGPRQTGKSTLALSFLQPSNPQNPAYLNWDYAAHRKMIQNGELPSKKTLVFDEIHKNPRWRNLIKGIYDVYRGQKQFIVTGSARLDHFKKGGDSLFGRYHYFRLHPFSVIEAFGNNANLDDVKTLLRFGGFPEPLFKGNERFLRMWQRERLERVVFTDIRDLENILDLNSMELLVDALPERVGSPLSIENLRQDLDRSHPTVKRWLDVLDALYFSFRISPFGASKIRAVKKEQKLYLWDWSLIKESGARFENMVASQLLKYCHFVEDTQGYKMELRFLRDRDLREIDFVVLKDKKPVFAVECKSGESKLSRHIAYFKERTPIPLFYQVHLGSKDYGNEKTIGRCLPFHVFCQELALP